MHAGTKKNMKHRCTETIDNGMNMAGTGSLVIGDAVFSEKITDMKDFSCFICKTEAPVQVFKHELS